MVLLNALVIFFLSALGDAMYTWWWAAASRGRAHRAGGISALMSISGAIFVYLYVEEPIYLIPEIIGSYVGSWWAVKRGKGNESLGHHNLA